MPAVLADPEPLILEVTQPVKPGGPGGGGPRDFEPSGRGGGGDDGDGKAEPGRPLGLIAMQFVLISVTTLFVTLAIVYLARAHSSANWQRVAMPRILWASTAIILCSSFSLERARKALAAGAWDRYGQWLLATLFLGFAFVISQMLALRAVLLGGSYPGSNPHGSMFFILTGTHALHLLGGLAAIFYLILRISLAGGRTPPRQRGARAAFNTTALYWHFLGALWVGLVLLLRFG